MDIVKNIIIEKMVKEFIDYKEEKQVLINTCEEIIKEYKEKIENLKGKIISKEENIKNQTIAMLDQEEYKETKTQFVYLIPSGKIIKKKESYKIEKDDTKLMEYLKNNSSDFIKTKEIIDWANFKKELIISNDKVLSKDGEIIEGCNVIKVDSKVDIKIED